jgi:rubrerythrin
MKRITNLFKKSCAGKIQHKTLLSAQYSLQNNTRQDSHAEIYICDSCGAWHIGTKSKLKQPSKSHRKRVEGANKPQKSIIKRFRY